MVKVALVGITAVAAVDDWHTWKDTFGKTYNGDEEDAVRQAIFDSNVEFITAENALEAGYTLNTNQFSDLTHDEFKSMYLTRKAPPVGSEEVPSLGVHKWQGETLLADVDWTSKGAVTGVKDQKRCGGCWAFSATGALEGANYVTNRKLIPLSEQQILDCGPYNSDGCNGGFEYKGWAYFQKHKQGICTESSYPYKGRDKKCNEKRCKEAVHVKGVTHVGHSANDLKSALNHQPVSVGINADGRPWQHYSGGIMKSSCPGGMHDLDHSVLAVGYSSASWKVKNSWGTTWGESGYFRMTTSGDECGIYTDASYPTVGADSVQV